MTLTPITFNWGGSPCRGVEPFTASTPDELFLVGLDALSKLVKREPRWVELSVQIGDGERFLTEQMEADFLVVADWFDVEKDALFRQAVILARGADAQAGRGR
jgi:hypothetical protein